MVDGPLAQRGEAAAIADIPMGRRADPMEVAEPIAFALQPSQASLDGATLDVDGGGYIRQAVKVWWKAR
ncbi:hypothetical protein FJM51_04230 [Amaricoccus solimangrovi]|uniref:Uncharacterized protein n=1 Tax=Amaricoccus solimangrovi TaxID=2589815 RepID=A0A501WYC2_9RHOB|nr:hypothetical protein FJM51_04230 [Amaricoccus solimangrovi]